MTGCTHSCAEQIPHYHEANDMQHLLCGELEFLQYICGVGAGPGGGIVLRYTTYTLGLGDPREEPDTKKTKR